MIRPSFFRKIGFTHIKEKHPPPKAETIAMDIGLSLQSTWNAIEGKCSLTSHHRHDGCACSVLPFGSAHTVRAARIECQPSPPQNEESHAGIHRIAKWQRIDPVRISANAWSEHSCRRKRRCSADQMHLLDGTEVSIRWKEDFNGIANYWSATGDVNGSQILQKAMRSPYPAGWDAVHRCVQEREKAIGLEIAPEMRREKK